MDTVPAEFAKCHVFDINHYRHAFSCFLILKMFEQKGSKMKLLIVLGLAVTLTGCGWFDRYVVANTTGYSKTCVEGVVYLQFPSGATPQYNVDGSLKGCK